MKDQKMQNRPFKPIPVGTDIDSVENGSRREGDGGFTLIELMIALMIIAIILAAVAPAFYGTLRATSLTDERSAANGLATAASEQIRSLPYYQVGYSSTPSYCVQSGRTPVLLSYSSPMDTTATSTTISGITYTIHSCVYWVSASDGSSQAYKQSVVTILWGHANKYTYSQTSALYPGGESSYSTAANNFVPATTVVAGPTPPVAPVVNSATPYQTAAGDTVTPQTTIQVNWQPVNYTSRVTYKVEYWTGSSFRPSQPSEASPTPVSGSPDGSGNLNFQVGALTPGTTYYFDVIAVSGTQTSSASNIVSATTAASSSTACTVNSVSVSPSTPIIDNHGNPVNFTSLAVAVQATSSCTGLSVEYGIMGSNGQPSAPLTQVLVTYNGGSFTGSTSQSTWSASTYAFVVYQNGTATTAQANVTPCRQNGNSGNC